MKLTEHFTLEEFCLSTTAIRLGIDNTPSPAIYHSIRRTAAGLERIRTILDKPIIIVSGYRSLALNQFIGGSERSQHMEGEAADIICPTFGTPKEVAKMIEDHALSINYDQLILEFGRWVHVSFSITPRRQSLTINSKAQGYLRGIVV